MPAFKLGLQRLALCALLIGPLGVAAQAPSYAAAAALVEAMRLDRLTLSGMQLAVQNAANQGMASEAQSDCAAQLQPSDFTDIFTAAVSKNLSRSETADALAFYSSAAGKKVVGLGFFELRRQAGTSGGEPAPALSDRERRAQEAFVQTSAGDKILLRRALNSHAVIETARRRLGFLLESCANRL